MLEAGARATVEHVLHEAAHVLCWVRNIKDTTMRGAYHNASYLAAAEEVGLQWPDGKERIRGRGYSEPELSDEAAVTYATDIAALSTIIPEVLPRLPRTPPPAAKRPDRLTLECGCKPKPRQIRVAQTVAALGPITCGVCGKEFTNE
ncbi:hypothetical protein [Streptomyces umbrinus]|uniref:hypothetical protein n=1 Tax=Streptomyces umbrinus TaxID=67370 RepID=UPI0034147E1C